MSGRDIHREIFKQLEDGVLVVGPGAWIQTLNPAAEHIPDVSARLRVVTCDNAEALTVPIDAVESHGSTHRVKVLDPATGGIEDRTVEIRQTTRESVEIRAGLEPGDAILAPGG